VKKIVLFVLLLVILTGCSKNPKESLYGTYFTGNPDSSSSFKPWLVLTESEEFEFCPRFDLSFTGSYTFADGIIEMIPDEIPENDEQQNDVFRFRIHTDGSLVITEGLVIIEDEFPNIGPGRGFKKVYDGDMRN